MDSATRYGSCVPVTTIGIPIFAPETNGRRIRRLIANAVGNVCGAPLKTDVGRHSRDDLVQAFRMLLGHFAGKMDCDLESSRFWGLAQPQQHSTIRAGSHLQVAATC